MRCTALLVSWVLVCAAVNSWAGPDVSKDLSVGGTPWLRTMVTPFDPERAEETYKVYTHVLDFAGKTPITKGPGGLFPHHRGLFIGWKDTLVNGVDYDTWHMPNCLQNHVAWVKVDEGDTASEQVEKISWTSRDGKPFIQEERTIRAIACPQGHHVIDFQSVLNSVAGTIELKGDLQHAGMQIRMANEVSEHRDTTHYILPEGVKEQKDNKVVGAWWVCGSMVVGGKRYWIIHMTPPDHPGGQPVYSIRPYARFGAFSEHTLKEGAPLRLRYRIVVSEKELTQADCEKIYQAYTDSLK